MNQSIGDGSLATASTERRRRTLHDELDSASLEGAPIPDRIVTVQG